MNYGFVIDNRLCIGCHACTVACKSEHDIPIGVNRTHVKYIEKGEFPKSKREFSVHRCNHCANAPCVEICPTTALYSRLDGIVDFDNERCIGCKSCMQACPYDALYIDPNTNTAAKCNYCAHRLDGGYEPACVIVCPVEAIVSGDLSDSKSKISQLVSNEQVTTRKPEKMTVPNLYYIDGSHEMLDPNATNTESNYVWTDQAKGVGHYAKFADERVSDSNTEDLLIQLAMENSAKSGESIDQRAIDNVAKEIQKDIDKENSRRVYDSPSKGVLWGWEVPAYVWTKAIATGTFLITMILHYFYMNLEQNTQIISLITSLTFMAITGALLVIDLDRPDRFLYVLLRPQWKSWLVKGAYIITAFGGLITFKLLLLYYNFQNWVLLDFLTSIFAILGASYTAFLFAQAKARDLWQNPYTNAIHMLIHAMLAGSTITLYISKEPINLLTNIILIFICLNLIFIIKEIFLHHNTSDTKRAVNLMLRGYYSKYFFTGIILGNIIPITIILINPSLLIIASTFATLGIFFTEFVRIRVPQLIPLS